MVAAYHRQKDLQNSKLEFQNFILTEKLKLYENMHQRKIPAIVYTVSNRAE